MSHQWAYIAASGWAAVLVMVLGLVGAANIVVDLIKLVTLWRDR